MHAYKGKHILVAKGFSDVKNGIFIAVLSQWISVTLSEFKANRNKAWTMAKVNETENVTIFIFIYRII